MKYIYIGKIVNTHGIKGEVRLISHFNQKDLVFTKGFNVYVGFEKQKFTINTYRVHKNYDMLAFVGITNINDIIAYKGDDVYAIREDIKTDSYILEDLVGMEVLMGNKNIGLVTDITNNNVYSLLVIGKNYVPFIDEFIINVDTSKKQIFIKEMEGLINED